MFLDGKEHKKVLSSEAQGLSHLWSLQKMTRSGNRTRTRTRLRNVLWANTRISTLRKHKFHDVMSWCFRIFPHIFLYEDTFHMLYNVPSHLFLSEGPITSLSNCQLDSPRREHLKGTKARRVDEDAVLLGEHKHGRAGGKLSPSPPWDTRSTRERWHSGKFCTLYLESPCSHKQWKKPFHIKTLLDVHNREIVLVQANSFFLLSKVSAWLGAGAAQLDGNAHRWQNNFSLRHWYLDHQLSKY